MTAPTKNEPKVRLRHEDFCQPTGGRTEVRIESFPYYADDVTSGRSRATHRVTRCMECGVAHYELIGA